MKLEEYSSILKKLPIKNPTSADMSAVCPHLKDDQAAGAFLTGSGEVACPPLRVRHGFQVLFYRKPRREETKEWRLVNGRETRVVTGHVDHPAELDWWGGRPDARFLC